MRAPHFDNDITWVNPSDWRNGMAQSDVWAMQLFGAAPGPIGIIFQSAQTVKRAAVW